MEEVWKDIKEYEEIYQVSTLGNIYSVRRGRELKQMIHMHNYLLVDLYNGGKKTRKMKRVHRLVAEAFIPNPLNKREVNHIDGDKRNNNVDNLEWATSSENKYHAYRTGLKRGRGKDNGKKTKEH